MNTSVGVMHIAQPDAAMARLRAEVAGADAWALTALAEMTQISGSLLLVLAVRDAHLSAPEAWHLSRIDEQWNIDEWGEDSDAAALSARREADFLHAADVLAMLDGR